MDSEMAKKTFELQNNTETVNTVDEIYKYIVKKNCKKYFQENHGLKSILSDYFLFTPSNLLAQYICGNFRFCSLSIFDQPSHMSSF